MFDPPGYAEMSCLETQKRIAHVRTVLIDPLVDRRTLHAAILELRDSDASVADSIDGFMEPLCNVAMKNKFEEIVIAAVELIARWIANGPEESVRLAVPIIELTVTQCFKNTKAESVRLALANLVTVFKHDLHKLILTIEMMLRDECVDVVLVGLSLASHVDADTIIRLLQHRSSRVRIAAISATDGVMRRNPWKGTFEIVQSLLGRTNENEIPVSEFFDPQARLNYMSLLSFDANHSVRQRWFETLIDWTVTLEDRADVLAHFAPYIFTGLVDRTDVVRKSVWASLNSRIAPAFYDLETDSTDLEFERETISAGAQMYIQNHAGRLLPALLIKFEDFQNCSNSVSARIVKLMVTVIKDRVIDHLTDLIRICSVHMHDGSPVVSEEYREIVALIGKHVESQFWWDSLLINRTVSSWAVLQTLLCSSATISSEVKAQVLYELRHEQPANGEAIFLAIIGCSNPAVDGIITGLLLSTTAVTDHLAMVIDGTLIPSVWSAITLDTAPERLLVPFLVLLKKMGHEQHIDTIPRVHGFVSSMLVVDSDIVTALCDVHPDATDLLVRLLKTDEEAALRCVSKLTGFMPCVELINALSDSITATRLEILTSIRASIKSDKVRHILDQILGCLKTKQRERMKLAILSFTQTVMEQENLPVILDVVTCMSLAVDDKDPIKTKAEEVIRKCIAAHPPVSFLQMIDYEKRGLLGRYVLLSQFIL